MIVVGHRAMLLLIKSWRQVLFQLCLLMPVYHSFALLIRNTNLGWVLDKFVLIFGWLFFFFSQFILELRRWWVGDGYLL